MEKRKKTNDGRKKKK